MQQNSKAFENNDYPIILIHGYCGNSMDENWILGGYFHYAFSKQARDLGTDAKGNKLYIMNVFEADVSAIGSIHDRACELYQQIIGIQRLQRIQESKGLTMPEAVYGKDHCDEFHRSDFYKVKYLKTMDPETKQMYAFPNGLPNFDKVQKFHIVGHSMGALTAQYLSHLLSSGYFDKLHGHPVQDKSAMIASITSISGANNGSYVVSQCGANYNEELNDWRLDRRSKMVRAFRYTICAQNFFSSQNRQLENIRSVFQDDNNETVYELGYQKNPIFYDMNVESWNWNRQEGEGRWAHFQRLRNCDYYTDIQDTAFSDMNPQGCIKLRDKIKTLPHIYYFSITHGMKKENVTKDREIFKTPAKISDKTMGFELDIDKEITFESKKLKEQYSQKQGIIQEAKDGIWSFFKQLASPVFSGFSYAHEKMTDVRPPQSHLNNFLNPDMNNIGAIDYANKDWMEDNDTCISRRSSEFPRLANDFVSHFSKNKPWGNDETPIAFNPKDNPVLQKDHMKPGVWYYGGIPESDHLDLSGLPDYLTLPRQLIGIEYRQEVWRLLFIRLRLLKLAEL